jgi:hypothetical protein
MRGHTRLIVHVLALAVLAAGCADDLPKATEIARMRVLGAELSVVDDELRTTPMPGESVRLSLSTQFPSLAADRGAIHSLLVTCTAPDRFTGGIPICQELIDVVSAPGASVDDIELPAGFDTRIECPGLLGDNFASPVFPPSPLSAHCKTGEPVFEVAIPEGYTADEVLFFGVVCERGTAVLDPALPDLFGCTDDSAEPISLHGLIKVQYEPEDRNENPDITALRLVREKDGVWLPVDPGVLAPESEMCGPLLGKELDPRLPSIIGALPIQIIYYANARELDADGVPEQLEFSVYATAGDLERRFTLFRPEDEGRRILDADGNPIIDADGDEVRELHDQLRWKSPPIKELTFTPGNPDAGIPDKGSDGLLVRFFVTVRDGRGGFAQADYALCAVNREP